jgi:hypothetical protein
MDNSTSLLDILEAVAQETALETGISVPIARARVRSAILEIGTVPPRQRTWREFSARLGVEHDS